MYVCCLVLSEIFFLTVPPITKAEEMIIRFLTIYCPSNVSPYGKSVKQTFGSKTNGRNVPGICKNNKNIDILIKGRKHIVNPITTSRQPRNFTNIALSSNQYTVFSTNY